MKTVRRTSPSEDETLRLAAALGEQLRGGELISLEGQLGSGKTCFVRGLAAGLGLDATEVCSPSFIICREYSDSRLKLVHVDAFRLKGPHDLDAIGWDELLESDDHVIVVEWPSRIREALPRGADVGYSSEDYEVAHNARFMQMRYALAPHLVMRGADHEWVLARDRPDLESGQELAGFRVVLVAADGTALLRRRP